MRLAGRVLERLGGTAEEVDLGKEGLRPLDLEALREREALLGAGERGAPAFRYARQFAGAEVIVVAAPYWDLSFPSALKVYFEHVMISGLTFDYSPEGVPFSLCRAERLLYVTTAGGPILQPDHGFGYVRSLAETFFGIRDIRRFSAEGLDLVGADVERLVAGALAEIDESLPGA